MFLKRGVVLGYLLAFILTVALGIFSYVGKEKLLTTGEYFSHSLRIVNSADRLLVICLDLESGQRGFVITGKPEFLQHYDSALRAFGTEIEVLRMLTIDNTGQHRNVEELEDLLREKIDRTNKTIQTRKELGFEAAQSLVAVGDGRAITSRIRKIVSNMRREEDRALKSLNIMSKGTLARFQALFIMLLVVPLFIMMYLFWSTNRHFQRRLKFESNLKAASAEINLLNRELESFTYSVSHDLRAPLRSVNGYAEILKEEYGPKLDEEGHRLIGVITKNAKRMGELIDDLLEFSRIGRKELMKSRINTAQLVRGVIDEYTEQHGQSAVAFKVSDLPVAYADNSMIMQVWVNLISNAIKYSSKRPQPVVEIGSFSEPDSTGFFVKDNGVGFDMKYVDKLFGVFQRLHKTTEFEGTGVGLALVKRIITRHHGRVWVEAKPDEGATFFFTLPRS